MNFRKVGHTCIQRAMRAEQREQLILTVMGESKSSQRKTHSLAFKGDQVWRGDSREKLAWTGLRWRGCRENSENHKVRTFEGWVIPFQPFYLNSKFGLNVFWPQFLFHMDLEYYAGIKRGRCCFPGERESFEQISLPAAACLTPAIRDRELMLGGAFAAKGKWISHVSNGNYP